MIKLDQMEDIKNHFPTVLTFSFILILLIFWINDASTYEDLMLNIEKTEKHKGAHIFGIHDTTNLQSFIDDNFEWITLVPWGFQKDVDSPEMTHHNGDSTMIKSANANYIKRINRIRQSGFKVFVKPHVWVSTPSDGKWRSDIFPSNDEDWELWKTSYRDFILRYAQVAQEANAEMFCIGTELSRLSTEKSEYWENLIKEIQTVYSGQLTYAANWHEEYEKITFWDHLDFIGIQAYFPLSQDEYPTIQQLTKGWSKYISKIESVHKKYNRNVLFTEMGYRSIASGAIKPWEWIEKPSDQDQTYSPETQANCYKAFFETVWNKKWFAGVHIWQLRSDHAKNKERKNVNFTPQGKSAEKIISEGFSEALSSH